MKPTRGMTLAALLLIAVVAPFTAYAVSADDNGDHSPGHSASHSAGHSADHTGKQADKPDEPGHSTGGEHAAEASAPGRAHADAMKAWAHCVADAASGPKASGSPTPPKEACGDKPIGPGRAKHEDASGGSVASPGKSGDHRPADRGHGHAH